MPTTGDQAGGGNFVCSLIASRLDGGASRNRTDDLMLAKHALYQLSYGPLGTCLVVGSIWFGAANGRPGQT